MQEKITQTVLAHFPSTQAIYLFGSYDTEEERAGILAEGLRSDRFYNVRARSF